MSFLTRTYQSYALYSIITAGILLRVTVAANSELRFDELISLDLISAIQGPWDILLTLHHDNNHPLASLAIFMTGVSTYTPGFWYRITPILSSLLSVVLLSLILSKRSKDTLPAILGTALFSSSLLSITLSSEIRGYSFAASAALLAFFLHYSRRDLIGFTGFNLACCIGFLSHATFILFFGAMGIADLILFLKIPSTGNRRREFAPLCGRYITSSLFLIVVYIIFYKYLPPVSAPLIPWPDTVASTLSLTVGGPWISMISRPIYIAVWMYAGIGTLVLIQSLRKTVLFQPYLLHFLLIIIIMPTLAILLVKPQAIAERYLYLPVIFSYLLFAEFFVSLVLSSGWKRFWGVTITSLILGGNIVQSVLFILSGDAKMHDLIKYCKENQGTKDSPLLIGGDHDLRIRLPLERIAAEYPNLEIQYFEQVTHQKDEIQAEWIISHYVDRAYIPPPEWQSAHGEIFYLVRTFPNYSLHSWSLFLYRKSYAKYLSST